MENDQLISLFQSMSSNIEFERFKQAIFKYEELTSILSEKQEREETHYTGADLNFLESLPDKICESKITQKDFLKLEKMVFKLM